MLRVNYDQWDQSPWMLRLLAQEAPHVRTRERFLALYEITQGLNATEVAHRISRENETVQGWVHLYNTQGPNALSFQRTGGRPLFVLTSPLL